MTRLKAAAYFNESEGWFFVRGTLDPHRALALAFADESKAADYYFDAQLFKVARPRPDVGDAEPDAEHVHAFGDWLHRLLAECRTGLYRINPAHPQDDDASWYLVPVEQRGHGAFEAVEFS